MIDISTPAADALTPAARKVLASDKGRPKRATRPKRRGRFNSSELEAGYKSDNTSKSLISILTGKTVKAKEQNKEARRQMLSEHFQQAEATLTSVPDADRIRYLQKLNRLPLQLNKSDLQHLDRVVAIDEKPMAEEGKLRGVKVIYSEDSQELIERLQPQTWTHTTRRLLFTRPEWTSRSCRSCERCQTRSRIAETSRSTSQTSLMRRSRSMLQPRRLSSQTEHRY